MRMLLIAAGVLVSWAVHAQGTVQPAISPFTRLYGEWRGTGSGMVDGKPGKIIRTQRIGPMMGGAITVFEERLYSESGTLFAKGFAVVSRTADGSGWEFHRFSSGSRLTFPVELDPKGFKIRIPAGPDTLLTTFSVDDSGRFSWEIERIPTADGARTKVSAVLHQRINDATWPAAGGIGPK